MSVPLRGLVGVVHLAPLPGDPRNEGASFGEIETFATRDAERYAEGGVNALVFENFGSAPFEKGTHGHRIPPHQTAFLALVAYATKQRLDLPVGVNCLRNDAYSALGIAAAASLDFIRVNVHTGAYVTDQGLIEGEAASTLRYRRALSAERVAIFADVLVKHAAPLAPLSPESATHEALDRGLADAVIVSGEATGSPVSREELSRVRKAAADRAVFLGSGLTEANAASLTPLADGAFVGTAAKVDGLVTNEVDLARVKALVRACAFRS